MEMVNEIIMLPIAEVKPYENNPRRNSKTVELLCEIIPKVGFNVPLVLDEDHVIVKGHARYLAAQRLGMETVPCVISHASPDEIKADRIADNRVFEFSKWVNEELMHEVDMLDIGYNLDDFGLPKMDVGFGFDMESEDDGYNNLNEEELKRRFQEMMERAEAEEPQVLITTEQEIANAKQRQREEANAPAEYYSVTCEKCGNIMYVRKGDETTWE